MSQDIFNRNVSTLAGVMTADRAKLVMPGNVGVLVQQLQFAYTQNVTRLFEVGNNGAGGAANIYYVGGRTQGQMSVNRIIGPSNSIIGFYQTYGDVCKASNHINLTLSETNCLSNTTGSMDYTLRNCVITSVSIGVAAADMIITENTALMFASLEVNASGAAWNATRSVSGVFGGFTGQLAA